jgi:hypothetical protein
MNGSIPVLTARGRSIAVGAEIEEHVHDCAILKRGEHGDAYFEWVTLHVMIGPKEEGGL